MPPCKVNSASPPHPRREGSPRLPPSSFTEALYGLRHALPASTTETAISERCQRSGNTVSPTACTILCVRFVCLVRRTSTDSATDATLDTGGWLTLSRQGLAPCKMHQASLGALTASISGFGDTLTTGKDAEITIKRERKNDAKITACPQSPLNAFVSITI